MGQPCGSLKDNPWTSRFIDWVSLDRQGSSSTRSLPDIGIRVKSLIAANHVYNLSSELHYINNSTQAMVVALGMIALCTSLLVLFVVCKSKQLRSKSFFLMVLQSCNDLFSGINFIVLGMGSLLKFIVNENVSGKVCCQIYAILFTSETLSIYLVLAMAIDRAVAVFRPVLYKELRLIKFQIPMVVISVIITLSQTVLMLWNGFYSGEMFLSCDSNFCLGTINTVYIIQGINVGSAMLIVLISTIMILVMRAKRKVFQTRGLPQLGKFKFIQQTREIKVQVGMMVITVVSQISGRICLLLALYTKHDDSYHRFLYSFRGLIALNAVLDFFVYFLGSCEFRTALKQLFFPLNEVSPF
ncbi:unnamed protein product [Soboliphyme baturini]|uniref:G_PROTEIN_RECEP_F1_2 domain-containing protein n=1 Tax=Soboliphyme baturini TaxID=241478 RepID=A0A183ILD8_9BILA|nr:unnamed protein product [Soboliphyme baturini]